MIYLCVYSLLLTCVVVRASTPVVSYMPEQVHISNGGGDDKMFITWVTVNHTESVVEYGVDGFTSETYGSATKFTDGGSEHRVMFIHRVLLTGLKPQTKYIYHCGSDKSWSPMFFFKTFPSGTNWSPRFAIYGDMGNKDAFSLARLQEETQKGSFDAVLHVGDFAYDMDWDNARVGDEFMRQIESIAAYVPYMTCPGNHEEAYNFSNYKNRFTMPEDGGDGEGLFYSWTIGPVRIISFSSEVYYFYKSDLTIQRQFVYLENKLREANLPENRAKYPWVIMMAHKPMYCTNADDPSMCSSPWNPVRVSGLEQLLYKYGVDIYFSGHEHSYERLWPVYDLTVCNGSRHEPYTNPKAPVHIITGSAGCIEPPDPFMIRPFPWSAAHSDDFGFTRMIVHNATHLYLEQVSDNQHGAVVDKMMLIRTSHHPSAYQCPG